MWARGPLLSVLVFVSARFLLTASAPRSSRKTCNVGGKTFGEGDRLKTSDPCLECQCSGGRVDCRLRICPKLPRPPPHNCFLLERPQSCCATMLCHKGAQHNEQARSNIAPKFSDELQAGCVSNGTVYGDGSAMVTSSLCEYCYCIRGKQHCVRPKCLLAVPGCKPEYAKHSCCPIKYVCSEMTNALNSTLTSTTSTPSAPPGSCSVKGALYPEGERLSKLEKPCEICYCVKGKPLCNPVVCDATPPPLCSPILSTSHCCPLSYNCSNIEENATTLPEIESKEIPIGDPTLNVDTTTVSMALTTDAETTTPSETTETTVRAINETDERFAGGGIEGFETTTSLPEETTTNLLLEVRNGSGKVKVTPDVIEAIINRTLEKDQDYEYDYNEPSLPPSLPNLKIIPFVAADAVLHENEEDPLYAESNLKTPQYPDNIKTTETQFSPPIQNMFSPPVETEGGFLPRDPSMEDSIFLTSGIKQDNRVTEMATVVTSEGGNLKTANTPQLRDTVTPINYAPESLLNLPAITVADVVVTQNPFRDVIRTEAPPDLEDIMKDRPVHTTASAPLGLTTASPPSVTSLRPEITTNTLQPATTTIVHAPQNSSEFEFGENLSFSSVLDYLFSGGSTEKTTSTFSDLKQVASSASPLNEEEPPFSPDNNSITHVKAQDRIDINITDTSDLDTFNNILTYEKSSTENPTAHKAPTDTSLSLLKLAGCNIYGRILSVGQIIDELSTSCLECLCTELGVQCRKLHC